MEMPMKKNARLWDSLIQAAQAARSNACAPYSKFSVGAALETLDGRIFTGSNVESSSYGLSVCAERVALFKALSEGFRSFQRLVVVTESDPPAPPCGACRQLLWDYARGIEILLVGGFGKTARMKLEDLLPMPFGSEHL
jgi:cytidine deaminase